MLEHVTKNVNPPDEQECIKRYEYFGWKLENRQQIYNRQESIDSVELTAYGDGIGGGFMKGWTGADGKVKVNKSVHVTNYVTLQFVRDTEMPNYAKLKELDDRFENDLIEFNTPEPSFKPFIVLLIITIALWSLTSLWIQDNSLEYMLTPSWDWLFLAADIVLSVLTVVLFIRQNKRRKVYYARMAEIEQDTQRLVMEAQELL